MDPDTSTMDPVSMNDSLSADGYDDAPQADGFCEPINDPPPLDFPTAGGCGYTPDDIAVLDSIEQEAACLFPAGKVFGSPDELRQLVRSFSYKKGFEVTTDGCALLCRRCHEPTSQTRKREKRLASDDIPAEKRRTNKSSTRCGCPFKICYSPVLPKDPTTKFIRITRSCIYRNDNGCRPSRSQLLVEKRKSGAYIRSINESQIKTILALLQTGEKIPPKNVEEIGSTFVPCRSRHGLPISV
jgi:hypothetical protein